MKLLQKIILIILLTLGIVPRALGDSSSFDWMNTDITALGSVLIPCIEAPVFSSIHQTCKSLNVENAGAWVSTGTYVQQGKMLSMLWDTSGISIRPRKYRVLFRIDPRFSKPQVFIQKYDYTQQKYISDFHSYRDGILPFYQSRPEIFSIQRFNDYNDYFNFVDRVGITVQKDDVVNVTLDTENNFFGPSGQMQNGLGIGANPITIYTDSASLNNKIFYGSSKKWCTDIITNQVTDFNIKCNTFPESYIDTNLSALLGNTDEPQFLSKLISIPSCPYNANNPEDNPACLYDKGRGMKVNVGNKTVKNIAQNFIYSPFTNKYFLYYYSDAVGDLNFTTTWPIDNMYQNLAQTFTEWRSFVTGNESQDISALNTYLTNIKMYAPMNFLHFGMYTMEVEIGSGHTAITNSDLNSVNIEYAILDTGMPGPNTTSNSVSQDFKNDAYASGYVWLRVLDTDNMSGNINVKIANYTGSNWFSNVVYGNLVKPLRDKYNELSEKFYRNLIGTPELQNIAKLLLTLYIIIYGLVFLLGAVQISATDIVIRVLKIGVIVALFSNTSWTFFNDNLFSVFIKGSDYLLTTIVGATSSTGNIFGFVDPIFDRYTNPKLWALLFIQVLQIHNGLAFFAIMTIYSILIYFRAILEVIISYCLAFLGIAVMISLAPFFIMLILFERTKSLFDNWISTLFSYMIQPTILLVFFLLIDQMMAEYITETVVRACWGILIPIKIGLDLTNIGIPISFSFSLPFLPGIPFYVPQVVGIDTTDTLFSNSGTFVRIASSTFIFFVYCKLASGLVEYVTLVVQHLTNVLAARQDGKLQKDNSPVKDIMGDMSKLTKPVTGAAKGVGSFAKEKIIDQKLEHRPKTGLKDVDYGKITRKEEGGGSEPQKDKVMLKSSQSNNSSNNNKPDTGEKKVNDGSKSSNLEEGKKSPNDNNSNFRSTGGSVSEQNDKPKFEFGKALSSITGDNAVDMRDPSKNSNSQNNEERKQDGAKLSQQTEQKSQNVKEERSFNTRNAGIGQNKLDNEQKSVMRENFARKTPGMKVERKSDNKLKQSDEDNKNKK